MLSDFQNAVSYFATVVSYSRKMFMKMTPGSILLVSEISQVHELDEATWATMLTSISANQST